MAGRSRQTWQKESTYHGSVLKDYRSFSGSRSNLQSQTMPQVTANLHWKQPGFSVPNVTKIPTKTLASSKNQYSFNKLHSVMPNPSTTYKNKRIVLYNQNNKSFKNSLVVQSRTNQITKDRNFSVRKVMNKRTVVNEGIIKRSENLALNNKNNQNTSSSVLPDISKVIPSNCEDLVKEITTLTQQLKRASDYKDNLLKRQILISKTEDKQNAVVNNLASNSNSSCFNSSNKYNLIKSKNIFSKNCDNLIPMHVSRTDSNSSLAFHNKQQTPKNDTKTNLSFKYQNSLVASVQAHKPFYSNNYCYEKFERQTLNSKTTKNILKGLESKDQILKISKKSVVKPQSLEQVVQSDHSIRVPNADVLRSQYKISATESKELMSEKQILARKVAMIKESSKYKMVKKGLDSVPKVKSPVISKVNSKLISIYSELNQRNSLMLKMIDAKQKNIRHSHKITPSSKKIKSKVNLKYKVINKADTQSFYAKAASEKINQSSKENSALLVDKSDPLYELLHESSTIDKLEQDLLAITSSLTDTPKSILKQTVNDKVCQKPCSKVNSKFYLKKTHVKKPKLHASKYKVINKHSKLQNCISLKRKSIVPLKYSAKKMNNKVICSKFSIVNKHPEPIHIPSPVFKGKSVLMKRLYKSKNAIINKNGSPTNISAKMIKSKYFTLYKRKSPHWQRHISYPKVPSGLQKFKGHCGMNKFSKQGRYQKSFVCHPKVSRKFSSYNYMTNYKFNTNLRKGRWMKKKVNIGQIQRNKIAKRIIVHNKAYIRAGNVKATTPISANLASRALHRSINRAVTASNKKNLRKVNTYCMFYNRFGRCNRGVKCTYIHDPSKIAVCTRFVRGTCKINGCPFSHEITPGKMAICSFFLMDACEKENCPYRHEKLSPDAELCKAFFQGYCPNGMECKKAHILICPKFIQGECEKGISCAYPHPPGKTKKNGLKDVAEKDEKKLDDILLEKVARYFQPCKEFVPNCQNASDKNEVISFVCPKRRQLEEQPSFIPLCNTSIASDTKP